MIENHSFANSMETELMKCALNNDAAGVAKFMAQAGNSNSEGKTALMIAAEGGYIECVKLLQGEAGRKDNLGRTAFLHACLNN